ncbi:hypothetical protein K432DRAFT_423346 [Lepidopterella palustris CBS 459.81]|uniref:Uncharacterized protein n=1 Tax=Lepidopterella palustris CBS 459.81 TaxID=1314670 RepID=A0A8E2JIG0_9PEZI|nr:hypothetical protein K432DRAFT_423346 [Lepidopterella palustris CBS 459.81]
MSASEVVRKRGRPKKVVASAETAAAAVTVEAPAPVKKSTTTAAGTTIAAGATRKVSTKAAKTSGSSSAEKAAKMVAKSTGARTVKVVKGKEVLEETTVKAEQQTTPVTPSTSKILQEVAASTSPATPAPKETPIAEPSNPQSSVKPPTLSSPRAPLATSTKPMPKAIPIPDASPKPAIKPPKQIAPVTPSTSKILQEVAAGSKAPTKHAPLPYKPSSVQPKPSLHSLPKPRTPPPPPPPPAPAPSKPSVPLPSTNSSAPAGTATTDIPNPNTSGTPGAKTKPDGKLPPKYKPAARRVTAIMVALPIVIVTSYELYLRLIVGRERRAMPRREPQPDLSSPAAFPPIAPAKPVTESSSAAREG